MPVLLYIVVFGHSQDKNNQNPHCYLPCLSGLVSLQVVSLPGDNHYTASSPEHFFTLECQSLITSVKFRLETEGYWNTGLRILCNGPYSPFLNRLQIKPNIIASLYKRIQIFILGTLGVFLFKCCVSWYLRNTVDTESLQI